MIPIHPPEWSEIRVPHNTVDFTSAKIGH